MTMTTVSTATTPELAARMATEAVGEPKNKERPEPVAPAPPDTTGQLPCGYIDKSGELHRTAEVSELNGADEEAMAKASSTAVALNTILVRGVQTVGGMPATPALLERLLTGDRDHLLVQIRRVTYGDDLTFEVACTECKYEHEATVSLSRDVPSSSMENPQDRYLTVQTSKGEAFLTLPDGRVQTAILNAEGKTAAEMNTILLQHCVTRIGDDPITSALDVRERMPARDRRALIEALVDKTYGPRLGEVTRPCPSCGFNIPLPMTLVDLFRV